MKAKFFGRKNVGDIYETPDWATKALLRRESLYGAILEPCCGYHAISRMIPACTATDIIHGTDFFSYPAKSFDTVITNPPYTQALPIIEHALHVAREKVLMLLRLSFLESSSRYQFFQQSPLRTVYVFSRRVTMFPYGEVTPKGSGTVAYAWFVWEHGYEGQPVLEWIEEGERA